MWTNIATGYLVNILTTTGPGLKWVIDYFAEVYRKMSAGDYNEEENIQQFRLAIANSPGMASSVKLESIDWKQLYDHCLKMCGGQKDDFIDGKPNYEKLAKIISKYKVEEPAGRLFDSIELPKVDFSAKPILMASIQLSWDEVGKVRHQFVSQLEQSKYNEHDLLSMSVPMLVASQLGVLRPMSSIPLCATLFEFIKRRNYTNLPMGSSIISASIDLFKLDQNVIHTFNPKYNSSDSIVIESEISKLLGNYTAYVYEYINSSKDIRITHFLLASIAFFLQNALPVAENTSNLDASASYPNVQMLMLQFSSTIELRWDSDILGGRYRKLVRELEAEIEDTRALWEV